MARFCQDNISTVVVNVVFTGCGSKQTYPQITAFQPRLLYDGRRALARRIWRAHFKTTSQQHAHEFSFHTNTAQLRISNIYH